jgi:hypothetical protein
MLDASPISVNINGQPHPDQYLATLDSVRDCDRMLGLLAKRISEPLTIAQRP